MQLVIALVEGRARVGTIKRSGYQGAFSTYCNVHVDGEVVNITPTRETLRGVMRALATHLDGAEGLESASVALAEMYQDALTRERVTDGT